MTIFHHTCMSVNIYMREVKQLPHFHADILVSREEWSVQVILPTVIKL